MMPLSMKKRRRQLPPAAPYYQLENKSKESARATDYKATDLEATL